MMALHVSVSHDIARLYKMQMNRAQQTVAFTIAFVYGMGQIVRYSATFGTGALCTDARLSATPFTAEANFTMVILAAIGFVMGKGVWGPALDKFDAAQIYLGLNVMVVVCTVIFTYLCATSASSAAAAASAGATVLHWSWQARSALTCSAVVCCDC